MLHRQAEKPHYKIQLFFCLVMKIINFYKDKLKLKLRFFYFNLFLNLIDINTPKIHDKINPITKQIIQ